LLPESESKKKTNWSLSAQCQLIFHIWLLDIERYRFPQVKRHESLYRVLEALVIALAPLSVPPDLWSVPSPLFTIRSDPSTLSAHFSPRRSSTSRVIHPAARLTLGLLIRIVLDCHLYALGSRLPSLPHRPFHDRDRRQGFGPAPYFLHCYAGVQIQSSQSDRSTLRCLADLRVHSPLIPRPLTRRPFRLWTKRAALLSNRRRGSLIG
jgi:hypothetical protein